MGDLSDRFVRETSDQLQTLSSSLLDLEVAASGSQTPVQVDEAFRIAHSLKGRFATEGLEEAGTLAHALEDVLAAIGTGRLEPTAAVIDDALSVVDVCQTILEEQQRSGDTGVDAARVRERLQTHVDSAESAGSDDVAPHADIDVDDSDSSSEKFEVDGLSRDVQEALDDASAFDDLDQMLEGLTEESERSWTDDDELDMWGVFEGPDETDREVPTDSTQRPPVDEPDVADSEDSFDEFISFKEMKEKEVDEKEDLEDLHAAIEAEQFGAFDEDDDMSIEELLDIESTDGATSIPADPGDDSSVMDDLRTFEDVRADVDPAGEDLEELQVDIEAEQFGEFDQDDDMSIEELLEADPSELDPEASLDAESKPSDGESGLDVDSHEEDEGSFASEVEREADRVSDDESAGDESAIPDGRTPASADSSDALEAGSEPKGDTTADDEFDLAAEDPFGIAGDEANSPETEADETALEEDELLGYDFPGMDTEEFDDPATGSVSASASTSDTSDTDDTDVVGEDFAFGFGYEEDYFDAVEFDSLFARYFSEDGVLFGGDPTGAAEAAATMAETRLDDERFETAASPGWQDTTGPGIGEDSIRSLTVDVDNADELLRLAEELGNAQRQLERAVEDADLDAVGEIVTSMRPYTTDLHQSVMSMRLMPLETVMSRLQRVARDTAGKQDKEVDMTITGGDVRLDRNIIERLEDPLVHLVRNAVDHGIEPPAERKEAGKPIEGTLEIRSSRSQDQVVIEVSDDGRGIDPEMVREAAVESGLVTERKAQSMACEDVLDLVFRPRFSTRQEVSDVSGRGVGMDAVRQTVRDLTGSVELKSTPGEGTAVRLTLPVTVAVSQVLFVYARGDRFALPTSVIDTVELAGESTIAGETANATSSDDTERPGTIGTLAAHPESAYPNLYPVARDVDATVAEAAEDESESQSDDDTETGDPTDYETIRLADAMWIDGGGGPNSSAASREKVVRIREDVRPLELHCEDVGELAEVVVRPFEDVLGGTPGISGTTTDGDEDIIPVLDVRSLEP